MTIVTAGSAYMDIDAYGGCIAYAQLLRLQGMDARAVSTAPLNESVTKTIREWKVQFDTAYNPSPDDTFVLIDVSDPKYFEKFVDPNRIREVIDHHPGLYEYWQKRIGEGAKIEFIGAACTQVYELWRDAGLLDRMTAVYARLLIAGILDNTLNFTANVTTERDKEAYADLLSRADLPADWSEQYFTDCQQAILADVGTALRNDTKTLVFGSLPGSLVIGQLVVWDHREIVSRHRAEVERVMAATGDDWFVNVVSIGDGKSYLLAHDKKIQDWLAELLEVRFNDSLAEADRLWLRKEILKEDIAAAAKQATEQALAES